MTKSSRILLFCAIALFVIAVASALIVFFTMGKKLSRLSSQPSTNATNSVSSGTSVSTNSATNTAETDANTPAQISQKDLETMAVSFSERFGSYSNHSDAVYQNIEELYIYMTPDMKKWAEGFVAAERAKAQDPNASYYGITTKALAPRLVSFDDAAGKAEFIVSTQRRENTGESSEAKVYYQDIVIRFLKIDSVWKVNEARWQ